MICSDFVLLVLLGQADTISASNGISLVMLSRVARQKDRAKKKKEKPEKTRNPKKGTRKHQGKLSLE
jgi:hypothetical protein